MSDEEKELDETGENEIIQDEHGEHDEEHDGQSQETEQEPDEQFEDPKELTEFSGAPAWFDRKKAIMVIAAILCVIVLLGLVFSTKNSKKKQTTTDTAWAANVPKDFLQRELEKALANASPADKTEIDNLTAMYNAGLISEEEYLRRLLELQNKNNGESTTDQYGLPLVTPTGTGRAPATVPETQAPPAQQQQQQAQRQPQPQLSPLVPRVEGSLFAQQGAQAPQQQAMDPYTALLNGQNPYATLLNQTGGGLGGLEGLGGLGGLASLTGLGPSQNSYAQQNDQAGKNSFYNAASGGAVGGNFLQENLLWIGTIIPAVLETAINTDLPGNVIARVTENIYDSHTGKNILVPQGTLLVAQYNSSVSYAQSRVQIVWDILIRPDGYQIELEGMNAVDPRGIAGLKAVYHENWFEYIKAAGIVSLFSLINSKMVEQVAKYGSNDMAAGVITSNAEFIKDLGGNFITRAMNIQPTLTVDSGEKINVMLNKNIFLPPFRNFEVKQRYSLR